MDDAMGLYLHIPICKQKCAYCDFASYAGRMRDTARICMALEMEMRLRSAALGRLPVQTVFVGGGTPTLLSGKQIARLLDVVRVCFDVRADAEITMEGNPGTLTLENLQGYRAAGVNRLSLGAQAMQPALLRTMGRIHTWGEVEEGVRMARTAGFDNLNVDVMYGLPGQTAADWEQTLAAVRALHVQHVSCYHLILEEGTRFFARYTPRDLPDEDEEIRMDASLMEGMREAGMHRYEISNYALPGRESRHNLGYWERRDYLGVGCAAHSLLRGERFANSRALDTWLSDIEAGHMAEASREILSLQAQRFEAMMLGLRLTRGVDLEEFTQRYQATPFTCYGSALEILRAQGLAQWDEKRLWLTPRGLDLQNTVLVSLMD